MEFKKKSSAKSEIPTASLPDIVFMLLLFFMVSTVLRQSSGLPLELPTAQKIEKLESKKNVSSIWARSREEISIDDKLVRVRDISKIMYQKRVDNPRLIVSLKFDQRLNMGVVSDIQEQLRDVDALRVNYAAKYGD
ncbi:MAG TPA: biopolymer transporter ExbD [bacterium]|nr:biopolymer transporter ExbD [bacterium]